MTFVVKHISGQDATLEKTVCRDVTCREYILELRGRLNDAKFSIDSARESGKATDIRAHVTLAKIYVATVSEKVQTKGTGKQEDWLKQNLAFRHSHCHVLEDLKHYERTYRTSRGTHTISGGLAVTDAGDSVSKYAPLASPAGVEIAKIEETIEFLFDRLATAAENLPGCDHCGNHRLSEFEAGECIAYRQCRRSRKFRFPLGDRSYHHQGDKRCPNGNPK